MSEETHDVPETEAVTADPVVVEAPAEVKKTRGRKKKEAAPAAAAAETLPVEDPGVPEPIVEPAAEVVAATEKPKAKRKPRAPKSSEVIDVVPIDSAPVETPRAAEAAPMVSEEQVEHSIHQLQQQARDLRKAIKAERYKRLLTGKI